MLLEEQTKNLEWLIVPKARVRWLVVDAASPAAGWESPGFACEGSVYKGFGSALLPSVAVPCPLHVQGNHLSPGLCSGESTIHCRARELCIAVTTRQTGSLQEL